MTPEAGLLAAIEALAAETMPGRAPFVSDALRSVSGPSDALQAKLRGVNASTMYAARVKQLCEKWNAVSYDGAALALAFAGAHARRFALRESVEIVWTGPATELVTTRNTSAVLFENIEAANSSVTLFSFASFTVAGLCERLEAAAKRGVRIRLMLETKHDSGGRLGVDASAAFATLRGIAEFYAWPIQQRSTGGVLHAKFALIDERVAFVTSANLTEAGLDRNLELGLVVRDGDIAKRLTAHVERLIATGALVRSD